MNILYGLYQPDEGEILDPRPGHQDHGPTDAIRQGIGMVHQHFMLVPALTVTENVMLGEETTKGLFLDRKTVGQSHPRNLANNTAWMSTPMPRSRTCRWACSSGSRSSKCSIGNADILILDEPTAVLTPQEVEDLFRILRSLASRASRIIFITPQAQEVLDAGRPDHGHAAWRKWSVKPRPPAPARPCWPR